MQNNMLYVGNHFIYYPDLVEKSCVIFVRIDYLLLLYLNVLHFVCAQQHLMNEWCLPACLYVISYLILLLM